jgi:hypothetical protein
MKEIMQRYEGREVAVSFNEGPPLRGALLLAGETAFTLLVGTREVSRQYSEVHGVTAEHLNTPRDPSTVAPDAIDDPGDLPMEDHE